MQQRSRATPSRLHWWHQIACSWVRDTHRYRQQLAYGCNLLVFGLGIISSCCWCKHFDVVSTCTEHKVLA